MQALPGSLIVCSGAPANTAEDLNTNKQHSVFTSHLLKHISSNLSIDDIMTMVCDETAGTNKNQVPFQVNELREREVHLKYQPEPGKPL
jgi:hypothetical protein